MYIFCIRKFRPKRFHKIDLRLLTLCNSFTPPEVREVCLAAIKEMLMLWPHEMSNILTPALHRAHSNSGDAETLGLGPFFPRCRFCESHISARTFLDSHIFIMEKLSSKNCKPIII
jgi:hypothetical protein